jgi:hypothetical protein
MDADNNGCAAARARHCDRMGAKLKRMIPSMFFLSACVTNPGVVELSPET